MTWRRAAVSVTVCCAGIGIALAGTPVAQAESSGARTITEASDSHPAYEWWFVRTHYEYQPCIGEGMNGVPHRWNAYQCRPREIDGGITAWDLHASW